jgi:hypothetical protein
MFDAYKVAVKLTLVNGVSAGLVGMAAQFQALNKHVNGTQHSLLGLEKKLLDIKRLGMVGGGMAAAGGFGLMLFKAPLEEAKKFQTEAAKFSSLGFGDVTNNQAIQFAKGMNTIGTSARDNMSIVGDAMAVFKDLNEAKMVAPLMAKMKFANEAIFGADSGDRDKKLMDMMKVAEFRGGTKSPEEFARQANFAQQAIAGSRNRVDPSAMLQALKTGGVALSRRSNEAFYLGAEPLLQEFGGSRYGTAAMSIYQNLVQSRGTITAQQELYRLGLLDKDKVQFNQLGKLKKALPGAFSGSAVLEGEGELALLEKVLLPAFAKNGITSEEGVLRELGMILGNRTGSSLMSRIYQQREKLHMQTDANYHAENLDQASTRASGTLAGKEVDLHKKWATLMNELGTTILPIAIRAVEGLTGVLKSAISFAKEYPSLTKGLTVAFGVLAGVVAVGGVLMLATAGFRALGLALSIGGFGGGGVALAGMATSLSGVGVGLLTLGNAIPILKAALVGWTIGTLIHELLPDRANDAIGGNIAGLLGMLGNKDAAETYQKYRIQNKIEERTEFVKSHNVKTASGKMAVYLDGRIVGEIVTARQEKEASRPQSGMKHFDGLMSMRPVGAY